MYNFFIIEEKELKDKIRNFLEESMECAIVGEKIENISIIQRYFGLKTISEFIDKYAKRVKENVDDDDESFLDPEERENLNANIQAMAYHQFREIANSFHFINEPARIPPISISGGMNRRKVGL